MRGYYSKGYNGFTFRDIELDDYLWLHEYIYSNPEITMWNSYMPHEKLIQSKCSVLRNYIKTKFTKMIYLIVYYDKIPVGTLCINEVFPGTATISYNVIKDYQNKGIGTNIVSTACELCENLCYNNIIAYILPNNKGSIRVCTKNGFYIKVLNWRYGAIKKLHQLS